MLLPRVLKKIPGIWYRGLNAFSVRQAEGVARNASKAMTCSAALSSVGMCMFVFAVVLRTQIFEVISSQDMSASDVSGPFGVIVFTCSFYAVVLLVFFFRHFWQFQQLSLAADNKERYYKLYELGASREILSKSLLTGVLCNFFVPGYFLP